MAEEVLAQVPDRPVRVKITNPDGSWSKATLPRIPHQSELDAVARLAGEDPQTIEVLEDEPSHDVYGAPLAPEYSTPAETPPEQIASPAPKPAKKAAASNEEGDR